MPGQFDIHYRWVLDDYVVVSRRQQRLTRGRRFAEALNIALAISMIAASVWAVLDNSVGWAIYFFTLGVFLFGLRFFVGPWLRRRQFAHQRLGEYEIEFMADENGFTTKSVLAEATHKWEIVRQVDDLAEHVLLWPNSRMCWMVPKRAFATLAEAQAFTNLAKEKTVGQTLF